ncbi:MAG: (d)CMP kinase [Planctomycetota bacterium]|nr:MAG: (d)CMP kinase [Planctomycetota bacterium]
MDESIVITIDGPAASGKSTVARRVAKELGFEYLDTGATFRVLTLAAMEAGVGLDDEDGVAELAGKVEIGFDKVDDRHLVSLNGRDVTDAIRRPEVTRLVVNIAGSAKTRKFLVSFWRDYAKGKKIVVEGRDQGTNAFPDARHKFFLNATVEERARRRWLELEEKGIKGDLATQEELERSIGERDESDTKREVAPLVWQPEDAAVIDTTGLSIDEVVERIVSKVRGEVK